MIDSRPLFYENAEPFKVHPIRYEARSDLVFGRFGAAATRGER